MKMPANYLLTYFKKDYWIRWLKLSEKKQKGIRVKVQKYLEKQVDKEIPPKKANQ